MSYKYLVVLESPGKTSKVQSFLGKEYKATASVGHIMDLPAKSFSIDIKNNFKPTYEIIPDKKDVVKNIKQLAKKAKIVYLMTDDDREGSSIAHFINEILPKGTVVKRAKTNSITKFAVQQAIENATDLFVDDYLVEAQITRRSLDRICGYRTSYLTKMNTGGTSAGRVQSVALRILAEREKEIKAFVPQEYWELTADLLSPKDKPFTVKLDKKITIASEAEAQKIYDKVKVGKPFIKKIETKIVSRKPYPPFVTQSLISAAKFNFGWSNSKTMKIAQSLYENSKITYMRSDSYTIDPGALVAIRDCIKTDFGSSYIPEKPNFYKNKKSSQEGHQAIIPTDIFLKSASSGDHSKLYDLIWKRTISSQSVPSEEKQVKVIVDINKFDFIANGNIMIFNGWKKIYDYISSEDVILPDLNKGDKCKWNQNKK